MCQKVYSEDPSDLIASLVETLRVTWEMDAASPRILIASLVETLRTAAFWAGGKGRVIGRAKRGAVKGSPVSICRLPAWR